MTYDRSIRPRNSSQVPRWLKPEDKSWNHETYLHLDTTTSKAVHAYTHVKLTVAYCLMIHAVASLCEGVGPFRANATHMRRLQCCLKQFCMVTGLCSDLTNPEEAEHH